jgi:hypothetical protein
VVAGDRGDPGTEVGVLDTSAGREDGRARVGKAQGYPTPHSTAGAGHEREGLIQIGHRWFSFHCVRLLNEFWGWPGS